MAKLNIGCGSHPIDGWDNLDRKDGREAWPLEGVADASMDEIRASHVLEHFSHRVVPDVLREWVRVLRPGGRMRLAVPDFGRIAEWYAGGEKRDVQGYVMGGHVDGDDAHGTIFDREALVEAMRHAGLIGMRRWTQDPKECRDCSTLDVSLNIEGWKAVRVPKVRMIMSIPRLAFTNTMFCVSEAAVKLRWDLFKHMGVWWHHGLTSLMEQSISEGYDYVVTVDYDTVFHAYDALSLVEHMEVDRSIDVLCPIQTKRNQDHVLLSMKDAEGRPITRIDDPTTMDVHAVDINTGHFGLTAIRCESLARMRKPWFVEQPDDADGWGDGRMDADIHFWLQARKSMMRTCACPQVAVGHLELMVAWPDRQWHSIHRHVEDWDANGKPAGTWPVW